MKLKQKIYIFLILTIITFGTYFWIASIKPTPFRLREKIPTDELSERNIVSIRVDSLTKMIRLVYENDAKISLPDSVIYEVTISGQGSKSSDFYNNSGDKLFNIKDDRFSIKKENNIVSASFKIETVNQIKYALVPTDIIFSLSEMAYNN